MIDNLRRRNFVMSNLLAVVLSEDRPCLKLFPEDDDVIALGERVFRDLHIDKFFGHYDWLRTNNGLVIGVRMSFLTNEFDDLLLQIKKLRYVSLPGSDILEVFFTDGREYDPDISDDQDLLDNRLFRSSDGTYAITFDPSYAIESLRDNREIALIGHHT